MVPLIIACQLVCRFPGRSPLTRGVSTSKRPSYFEKLFSLPLFFLLTFFPLSIFSKKSRTLGRKLVKSLFINDLHRPKSVQFFWESGTYGTNNKLKADVSHGNELLTVVFATNVSPANRECVQIIVTQTRRDRCH